MPTKSPYQRLFDKDVVQYDNMQSTEGGNNAGIALGAAFLFALVMALVLYFGTGQNHGRPTSVSPNTSSTAPYLDQSIRPPSERNQPPPALIERQIKH